MIKTSKYPSLAMLAPEEKEYNAAPGLGSNEGETTG
jgi:hypothetical protein